MELSLPHVNLNNNSPSLYGAPPKQHLILHHNNNYNTTPKMLPRLRMGCLKGSSLAIKLESELEEVEKEGEEWKEMENCKGKTIMQQQSGGLVELLECLEKEAIMGNDEGREPFDYNRRAQIFDKSSKVFQTLKQLHSQTDI